MSFLSLLNMPGIDHILFPDGDEMTKARESIRKIASKLNDGNKLRESFEELQNVHFCSKISYAFRNPFLVIASLGYTSAQVAFVVLAIIAIQNESLGTFVYIIYCIFSIIIAILANVYVFLVVACGQPSLLAFLWLLLWLLCLLLGYIPSI